MTEEDPAAIMLRAVRRLLWLLVVPIMLLLAVLTVVQYWQRMEGAERDLARHAEERAQELEAIVRPAMAHVQDLRELMESQWAAPPDRGSELRQALNVRHAMGQPDGWSLDGTPAEVRERLGQIWWADPDGREPDTLWLRRAHAFVDAARIVHRRSPGFEATWFAAAQVNTSFGYPWVDANSMLRSMGEGSLMAIAKPRGVAAQRSITALARDRDDTIFWGSPYVSQLDGQLVLSHGAMVVVDGRYQGEISLDFRLDVLQERANNWRQGEGRVWIADAQQQVLADSAEALKPPSGAGQANLPIRQPLVDRLPHGMGSADLDQTLFSPGQVYRRAGWVLLSAVRIGSPWLYVQAVPEATLRIQVLPSLLPNALLGLALLALFVAAQWLVSRRFVRPALAVLNYLRQRSLDADLPPPNLGPRWQVWTDAVTKVFRAQHELRQRERRSEIFKSAIVDNAVTAIVTTDIEGHIVEFNPTAERLFGRHRDGVMGRVLGEVLLPERRRSAHRAEMARLRRGERIAGVDRPTEMLGLRADGLEFPFEMLVVEIDIDDQVFFTGFMTDLTERRSAALQIERQRDALRQSEKLNAMGSLLAGVAHELNNPLAIVMGRASLLEEKTEGTSLADDAHRIREAAERCGRIVRSFLNMARQKPAHHAPVQLNDIVRAAAEMLGYTLRSHGVDLNLDLAENLPEVMADGDQIGQVVLNLMVNAQQALTAAEPPRRIALQTGLEARRENRESRVWLCVQDNGPGIAIALRDRVFEPFFTTKGEGIGTGLGLSVSRAMVREHGGDLSIESSERGARFRLGLPIAGGADADKPSPRLDAPQDAPQARVLVVDDEAEITDLIRAMLESAGYEVATAESGALALGLLEVARFDAIISDLRMPDMDGAALWRQVATRSAALAQRMLFATGDALSADARQMLAKTGCRSMEKPFSKATLLETLREVLQS